jgi:hypothetical protein
MPTSAATRATHSGERGAPRIDLKVPSSRRRRRVGARATSLTLPVVKTVAETDTRIAEDGT